MKGPSSASSRPASRSPCISSETARPRRPSCPAAVLDAALSAADGGLNIEGAVQALEASPGAAIQVTGDGRQMRVWIDTEAGQ